MTGSTRRELLELLRDELLVEIGGNRGPDSGKELPALSRELRQVLAELDGIPAANATAPADEIKKRREERRRKAAGE